MSVQLGQTLGNYRVVKKLGAGGMGTVYLAEHPVIGKKVALKVIRRALAQNPEVVGRFFDEARAVNQIGSEHIVAPNDFGQTCDGDHFFVMELLEGRSLAEVLRTERTLEPLRALRIVAQITAGLSAAHAAGIIHRDLKPDNIFLIRKGTNDDYVKILDFGLAQLHDAAKSALVDSGGLLGTPHYMSPEQCESRIPIDARSDIYAVGVLLYQMVTGQPPFDGAAVREILLKHRTEPVPLPRDVNPAVPIPVERIVLRCLAKRPDDRYASMAELRAAITAVRRSTESAPRPIRRGVVLASALLALLLSVGAVQLLRPSAPVSGQRAIEAEKPTAPPAPAPEPRVEPLAPLPIEVRLSSVPMGAQVVDERGTPIGTTPLMLTVAAGATRPVVLRLPGYLERHEMLSDSEREVTVPLERLRRPRPRPPVADRDGILEPRLESR